MSYILDALKKSEQERAGTPILGGDSGTIAQSLRPFWLKATAITLAVNIVLVGAVAIWFSTRESRAPAPTGVTSPTESKAPAAAPAPHADKSDVGDLSLRDSQTRDLSEEARGPTPAPTRANRARRDAEPTLSPGSPDTPASEPVTNTATVPLLRQMPQDFQRAVPEMAVNIHVYSTTAAQSILYINNRQYRAGESVADGVRLDAIVPDGAVLSYNGQQFKLARPN